MTAASKSVVSYYVPKLRSLGIKVTALLQADITWGFFCPLLSGDLPLAVPLSPQREVNWTTVFVLFTMFYGDGHLCNREPVFVALTETFPLV